MQVALGIDASQAAAGASQWVSTLSGINESIDSSIVKMVEWNAKAKQMKATFETTFASGKVVSSSYEQDLRPTIRGKANQNYGNVSFGGNKIIEDSLPQVETLSEKLQKLKDKFMNIAMIQVFRNAISELSSAFMAGAKAAIEFEAKIAEIRTISQDMGLSTGEWANSLEKLSNKFGVSNLDVAAAAYETLSNQVARGAQVFSFLNTALEFSKVTQASAMDSVNLLTSALNSFQMGAERADYVSAVLFKTIDLGRVKASEIANTFGRVAQMAAAVGVSLEETSASLVVLTSAGIKPAEAMTLVTNVMQKLLRPSEEMKALLASWGTPTAEAAISTFGYVGVLKKLEEASHGSATEMANLFHEIRAGRGAVGLSLFGDIEGTIEKIKTESEQSYEVAKKITEASPARTIQREFTTIKNFFIEFGRTGLEVITTFSNKYMSLSDIVANGTKLIIASGAGWVVYKSYVLAGAIATGVYNVATGAATVTQVGFMGMLTKTQVTLGTLITSYGAATVRLGAFAAAAALAYGLYDRFDKINSVGSGPLLQKMQEETLKKITAAPSNAAQNQANETKSQIDALFGSVLNNLSRSYTLATSNLTRLRQEAHQLGTDLRVAFDMGVNRLKADINDISRTIGEIKSAIKSNEKFAVDFGEKIEDAFFNQTLKYANEAQQIQLLQGKIESLNGSIERNAAIAANPANGWERQRDAIEKFKAEANQLIPLYIQMDDKLKAYAEQQARWAAQQNQYYNHTSDPVWLNANAMLERLRQNLESAGALVNRSTQQINAGLTETARLQQEILVKKKAELDMLEKSAKDYMDIQKAFETGAIEKDPRFQTQGSYDPKKAAAAFREASRTLTALAGAQATYFVEFWKKQQEVETNILQQGLEQRSIIKIKAMQNDVLKQKKAMDEAAQAAADAQKTGIKNIFDETSGSLTTVGQALDKFRDVFNFFGEGFFGKILGSLDKGYDSTIVSKAQQDLKGAIDTFNQLKQIDISTPAGLEQFNKTLADLQMKLPTLKADLISFLSAIKGTGVDLNKIYIKNPTLDKPGVTAQELFDKLQQSLAATGQFSEAITDSKNKADALQKEVADTFGAMASSNEAFKGIIQGGSITQVSLQTNFSNISTEIQGTIDKANALAQTIIDRLANIGPINIPVNIIPNTDGMNFELPPIDDQFYASGGRVNGPRGSDTIPAWLTKGEFVMNREATSRFYSQLVAMNSSVRPGYYSQGGYVTTKVGDIHVNMTSTGSAERDVRNFAGRLRREIKRGTIRLN